MVSVIGFDDSLEAMIRQMSSYNFDGASWIRACLDFVLGSSERVPLSAQGYVVQRRSTDSAARDS